MNSEALDDFCATLLVIRQVQADLNEDLRATAQVSALTNLTYNFLDLSYRNSRFLPNYETYNHNYRTYNHQLAA